jgi:hypothetical protein
MTWDTRPPEGPYPPMAPTCSADSSSSVAPRKNGRCHPSLVRRYQSAAGRHRGTGLDGVFATFMAHVSHALADAIRRIPVAEAWRSLGRRLEAGHSSTIPYAREKARPSSNSCRAYHPPVGRSMVGRKNPRISHRRGCSKALYARRSGRTCNLHEKKSSSGRLSSDYRWVVGAIWDTQSTASRSEKSAEFTALYISINNWRVEFLTRRQGW